MDIKNLKEQGFNSNQAKAIMKSKYYAQQGGVAPKPALFGAESMFPITRIDRDKEGNYVVKYVDSKLEPAIYSKEDFEAKMNLKQPSADYPGQYDPYILKYLNKTDGMIGRDVTYQQEGGMQQNLPAWFPNINPNIQGQAMSPQQDFSVQNTNPLIQNSTSFSPGNYNEWDKNNDGIPDNLQPTENTTPYTFTASNLKNAPSNINTAEQSPLQEYNDRTRVNVINPFNDVGLEESLMYGFRGLGNKNPWQAGVGLGLSAIKGTRTALSGFASGKEDRRVQNEYFNNLFKPQTQYQTLQQGGKVKNSELLTGEFVADEGQGNVNTENGEYIKRASTGKVQEVVGESHIKNGKVADGVDINLNEGDKVLSNYTKIGAKTAKELKDRYDLSVKKDDTFAKVLDKYNKKLKINNLVDDLSKDIEKLGENEAVKDVTTKTLNESALVKMIQDNKKKLDILKQPQAEMFEELFNLQERIPKKGKPGELLDEGGKVVEETEENYSQQGGLIELANQYNISPERALELTQMAQQGMEQTQDPMQQVFQAVTSMLQQGMSPEEIAQQLVSMGVPQENVVEIIQEVANQMQGQSPQEEQMEGQTSNPQEEQQEMAQQGRRIGSKFENPELYKKQEATTGDWTSFGELLKDNPQEVLSEIKRVHPELYSKYFKDGKIPSHGKIGEFQDDINKKYESIKNDYIKTYGADSSQVKELESYIEADKFVPQELKSEKGTNTQIRGRDAFLGNYTSTRPNFAIEVLPKDELEKVKKEGVNTAWELKQKFPDLYSKYVGEKGLQSDFWLGETASPVVPPANYEPTDNAGNIVDRNITKNVLPNLPIDLRMPPSALTPLNKEQINLDRIEPIKMTPEPMLAEQERQRQTDVERVQMSGLPPQMQEAILSQGLASSQMASNDAISKTENFNAQNQFQTDQFNIGQAGKEDVTNANFNKVYQDQMLASVANTERDWRNYFTEGNLQRRANWDYIENVNMLNATNDQFAYIPGAGVEFLNNKASDLSLPSLTPDQVDKMTPEEYNNYIKTQNQRAQQKSAYANKSL